MGYRRSGAHVSAYGGENVGVAQPELISARTYLASLSSLFSAWSCCRLHNRFHWMHSGKCSSISGSCAEKVHTENKKKYNFCKSYYTIFMKNPDNLNDKIIWLVQICCISPYHLPVTTKLAIFGDLIVSVVDFVLRNKNISDTINDGGVREGTNSPLVSWEV